MTAAQQRGQQQREERPLMTIDHPYRRRTKMAVPYCPMAGGVFTRTVARLRYIRIIRAGHRLM